MVRDRAKQFRQRPPDTTSTAWKVAFSYRTDCRSHLVCTKHQNGGAREVIAECRNSKRGSFGAAGESQSQRFMEGALQQFSAE